MLLELRELSRSLAECRVVPDQTDDHLVSYPKRVVFQIDLDSDGKVKAVRPLLDSARVATLRKYVCSKGGRQESTPGFNIDPLFRSGPAEDKKVYQKDVSNFQKALKKGAIPTASERQTRLEHLLQRSEPNWQDRARTVDQCLKVAAETLYGRLNTEVAHEAPELDSIRELLQRSLRLDASQFHGQLAKAAQQQIIGMESQEASDLFVTMLFVKPTAIVLELADSSQFVYPANHEDVWKAINRLLLAATQQGAPESGIAGDESARGIFGEPMPTDDEKMPQVKVPRLGSVKLRSMSKAVLCQVRYGMIESAACPVGQPERRELAAALDWITQAERENVTWADVSESCGFDLPALLLAYPATLPPDPPQLSGFFAGPGRDSVLVEHKFEAFARTVTERLQGVVHADPRTLIRLFVIARADKARTKMLLSRQYTAQRVIAAAEEWQVGARNIPSLRIRRFTKTRGQTCWQAPLVPFPAQVVWCLNTSWLKAATETKRVAGITIGDSLTLLLDAEPTLQVVAGRALRQALANTTPLLLALGQSHQLPEEKAVRMISKLAKNSGKQGLLLPSILGLLLAKLNFRKERYMHHNHYLIGRMLNLADQLHAIYCKAVRDGSYPPRLLGNSLMPTALENPTAGLARLSERLLVYQGWATAAQSGDSIALAKWLLGELAKVERDIDKSNLSMCSDDTEKAQMLLGYLARPEQAKTDSSDNSRSQQGEPQ